MLQLLDYRLRVSPPALESLVQQLMAGVVSAASSSSVKDDSSSTGRRALAVPLARGASVDQARVLASPRPVTRNPPDVPSGPDQAPTVAEAGVQALQRVTPPSSHQAAHAIPFPVPESGSASPAAGSGSEAVTPSFAAVVAAPKLQQEKMLAGGLVGNLRAVRIDELKVAATDCRDPFHEGASIATATHRVAAPVAPHLSEAIQVR